jgi:isoprenylcysteine carboxyl methyltransferase (ICMT) family protein YpbQ
MMKGTGMRNKIIFLLIFVFSFIIVHDTVLDVMQSNHDSVVTQVSDTAVGEKEYQSLHHLHNMFHFVALIEREFTVPESPKTEASIPTILLACLYFDREQDERPPIV